MWSERPPGAGRAGSVLLLALLIGLGTACSGTDDSFGGDDDTHGSDDDDDTTPADDDDDTTPADDDDDATPADDDDDNDATPADDDDDSGGEADDDDDSATDDDDSGGEADDDDSSPLTVALVDTGSSGVAPIENILTGEGHTVERMDYATVESSLGAGHDVLVYPGSGSGVWAVIGDPGLATSIRDFVAAGGGYIGVCGGSIVGASDLVYNGKLLPGLMLGLLDVEATYHDDYAAYVGNMVELQLLSSTAHDALPGISVGDVVAGDYAGGPSLASFTEDIVLVYDEDLDPGLAGYEVSGTGALAAGEYGAGRVVLSAVHPEYNHPDVLLDHLAWVRP